MNELDFKQQLNNYVNSLGLTIHCKFGALKDLDSMTLNEIAGGRVVRAYMDGAKDKQLNYEFACKSQDTQLIEQTLNKVAIALEQLNALQSSNNSYDFGSIETVSMPFPSAKDEKGYFIYRMVIKANLTTNLGE